MNGKCIVIENIVERQAFVDFLKEKGYRNRGAICNTEKYPVISTDEWEGGRIFSFGLEDIDFLVKGGDIPYTNVEELKQTY